LRFAQIHAKNEAGMDALVSALGTGDSLKIKINTALTAQGLQASTGVTAPSRGDRGVGSAAVPCHSIWALTLLAAFFATAV
jgi:hypothetical protein